jgi:hypothetical protein
LVVFSYAESISPGYYWPDRCLLAADMTLKRSPLLRPLYDGLKMIYRKPYLLKKLLKKQLERKPSALILVGYDLENTIRSLSILDIIIKEWPISRSILVLNSDNYQEVKAAINIDSWHVIRGSNNDREFSGYQEGLDVLRSLTSSDSFSNVIFANDTLAKRDSYLRSWMLERALDIFTSESRGKIAGKKGKLYRGKQ